MGYKNPILTEIYAEIALNGEGLGPSFIDIVPRLKAIGLTEIELAPIRQLSIQGIGNEDPKVTKEQVARVRIWNSDRTKLAQLSKSQIAVNLVGKYPGWVQFTDLFKSVLAEAQQTSKIKIDSILLGTLDRALVPSTGFKLGQYLNTNGSIVPRFYENCSTAADLIMGSGVVKNDGENKQFQISALPRGSHFEITIQSKFQRMVTAADKVEEVLEKLHDESNTSFEDIITERVRSEVMGGKNA